MPIQLTCPHCSAKVTPDMKVCPGCGAQKKVVGATNKTARNVFMLVGAVLGGGAGFGVKWYFYPQGAGIGSYVDAIALGIVAGGLIVRFMFGWDQQPDQTHAVWEKPKA